MLQNIWLFLLGFYILIAGSRILIDGASAIARKFRVSNWIIGLTIVGIGTSIPEFSLTVLASLQERSEIALGTVIGSNTANLLFLLGIGALIFPFKFHPSWIRRDLPWNIFAVGAALVVALGSFTGASGWLGIARLEGLALVALFFLWLYRAVKNNKEPIESDTEPRILAVPIAIFMILAGIVGIYFGGEWVLGSAIELGRLAGISEAILGLVLIGIGTSVPELAVTIVAALKRQTAIAVGNIIGSNIFDFLLILGFASLLQPIEFASRLLPDIVITLAATLLLFGAVHAGKTHVLTRWHGALFVLLYFAYLVFLFTREFKGAFAPFAWM